MKTSEARKAALRVAVEVYESASGDLGGWRDFDVFEAAKTIGLTDRQDAQAIWDYLTSVGVMEPLGLGENRLRFTPAGIAAIEASTDAPGQSHGPFPPLNVVIGDVQAGAQVAIGAGSFTQSQSTGVDAAGLREIVELVREASPEWPEPIQKHAVAVAAVLASEASSGSPDPSLVRAALTRIGRLAETTVGGVATQTLLYYLKAHGVIP